jgi:tryptophanyl-tRNA synthetase
MRPTGALHLGHYHGALKNWVRLQTEFDCFYFVADWHALTTHYEDREVIEKNVYDMVIDWIAAGLDPEQCTIFIQSRLPEHAELFTLLAMGTPLAWLERMPTYKDQMEKLKDRDLATYGFLGYPLLQAADILIYKAAFVPVGEDQAPHVEITREVARRFNHLYGPHFTLPEAVIDEAVATLPGLDGRKMSKSYDNTIGLFSPPAQMRKQIGSIVTDSRAPGEPKDTEGSALFQIFQAFASPEETTQLRKHYAEGIAWGEAKNLLFERIDREIAPMRERYEAMVNNPAEVERILLRGAEKARERSRPFIARLRDAVGLRSLVRTGAATLGKKADKVAVPVFKQYREADGRHYFKLVDASGGLLLQSQGFDSPREAGQAVARLREQGLAALAEWGDRVQRPHTVSENELSTQLSLLRQPD